MRVEVAAVALVDRAVGDHEQLGARPHGRGRVLLEPLDRAVGPLRLEAGEVDHACAAAELLPEVLEQVGLVLARDGAVDRVAQRRQAVVPAEDHPEGGLDGRPARGHPVEGGPRAEHGAAGEVLDLALAVDRRVGHHRHRLLEEVGQVLALWREAGERAVVAERPDRLGTGGRHLLDQLHVLALPAEAAQDAIVDLHRLGRAGARVAGHVLALERAAGGNRLGEGRGRPGPRPPALQAEPLQLTVADQLGSLAGETDQHLLSRRERLRLRHGVPGGDHARLAREHVRGGGLELPERAQAERVDREDALPAVARDQGHGPLCHRAERLAQVHVEPAQVLRHALDLVHDRRQHQLQCLDEAEPVAVDQRLHGAVEVLRVRAPRHERHAQHARLLAQARDGVDLAVVPQHAERLHAPEARPGVRGVAVVAEDDGRPGGGVAEVGVVAAQHRRRAERLVDDRFGGARRHVQLEAVLQQGGQLEAARRLTDQAADLPEQGFLLARLRPQRGAVDRAVALGQHAQPDPAHQLAGAPLHGGAGPARDQHVGDGERRIERQVRRVAAGAHLLGPQVARDVEH